MTLKKPVQAALLAASMLAAVLCPGVAEAQSTPSADAEVTSSAHARFESQLADAAPSTIPSTIFDVYLQQSDRAQTPSSPPGSSSQQPAAPQPQPAAQTPSSASSQPEVPDAPKPAQSGADNKNGCAKAPCPPAIINWYMRFENGPQVKPLTPREKGWLATKNIIDPFNMITILGEAGIAVAADSHSPYGPGFLGWQRDVGVSFTEDITGEFFGTFLIPSIVHQDPHYHRMPHASYAHRIFHAIDQVVWTQGDNGKGMLNYANLVGYGIDDEIANLYIPGRETNASASAQRYVIGLASAPIDNFVSEFLPDVARRIHVQVVIVQRIINQVASKDSGGT